MRLRKTERAIIHEADKIASLKEDFDAMSWARIDEIADELRKGSVDEAQRNDLAREMTAIAEAHKTLMSRLGFEEEITRPVMSSGIEIPENLYGTPKVAPTTMTQYADAAMKAAGVEDTGEIAEVRAQVAAAVATTSDATEVAGPAPHQLDRLPDWAVGNAKGEDVADFFDDSTDERDRITAGMTIPRGARRKSETSGAAPGVAQTEEAPAEPVKRESATDEGAAAVPSAETVSEPEVSSQLPASERAPQSEPTTVKFPAFDLGHLDEEPLFSNSAASTTADEITNAGVPDSVAAALEKFSKRREQKKAGEQSHAAQPAPPRADEGQTVDFEKVAVPVGEKPAPEPEPLPEIDTDDGGGGAAEAEPEPVPAPVPEPAPMPKHAAEPKAAAASGPEPASEPAHASDSAPKHAAKSDSDADKHAGFSFDFFGLGQEKGGQTDNREKKVHTKREFSRFSCIYESDDGALALFEDSNGHITAVDTSKLV